FFTCRAQRSTAAIFKSSPAESVPPRSARARDALTSLAPERDGEPLMLMSRQAAEVSFWRVRMSSRSWRGTTALQRALASSLEAWEAKSSSTAGSSSFCMDLSDNVHMMLFLDIHEYKDLAVCRYGVCRPRDL